MKKIKKITTIKNNQIKNFYKIENCVVNTF